MIYRRELSNIGIEIDDSCTVHSHVWIGDKVIIGKNVKIQAFAFIPNGVTIEDNVFIGPHVCFTNDPHMDIVPTGRFKPTETRVLKRARIGANACILAGVTIGEGATIGMGAVILKNVGDNEVWVGNPARRIKVDPFLGFM